MPVATLPERWLLRRQLETAVNAGLPVETQEQRIALFQAPGTNTLIHRAGRYCPVTRRKYAHQGLPVHRTLAELADEKRPCRCVITLDQLGEVGDVVAATLSLQELRTGIADLNDYPHPHRWGRWLDVNDEATALVDVAERLDNEPFSGLLAAELAALARLERTVVAKWRTERRSSEATVWWAAALRRERTAPRAQLEFLGRVFLGDAIDTIGDETGPPELLERWNRELHVAPAEFVTALVWGQEHYPMLRIARAQWAIATHPAANQAVVHCPKWVFGALRGSTTSNAVRLPHLANAQAAGLILEMIGTLDPSATTVPGLANIVTCAQVAAA